MYPPIAISRMVIEKDWWTAKPQFLRCITRPLKAASAVLITSHSPPIYQKAAGTKKPLVHHALQAGPKWDLLDSSPILLRIPRPFLPSIYHSSSFPNRASRRPSFGTFFYAAFASPGSRSLWSIPAEEVMNNNKGPEKGHALTACNPKLSGR